MKILYLCSGFLPEKVGAMELHMQFTAKALIRQGHDVVVFCREYSPGKPEFVVESSTYDGIPVRRMNYKYSDCTSFEHLYSNPTILKAVEEVVDDFRPDVVHIHHLNSLTMDVAEMLLAAQIPYVMTLHDYWMGCPRTQRITAALETCPEINLEKCLHCLRQLWPGFFNGGREDVPRAEADAKDREVLEAYHEVVNKVLRSARKLIAPSRFVKRIYERYGIDRQHISIIPHGLDRSHFAGVDRVRSPVFRFGYLGPVIPSKGAHILIEAFKLIGGSDCSLQIWGEVLPYHKDTNYGHRLMVLSKGWETSIDFHSRYENRDVAKILANIDVLVIPSIWYEANPMTLREAFLSGTAVIVSNFGVLAEAVDDGVTGLLFNVGDSVHLSEKMKMLKDDRRLLQQLVDAPKDVPNVEENVASLKQIYGI